MRRGASRSQRLVAVLTFLLGAALLPACAQPSYAYVKSSGIDSYFRLPRSWTVFGNEQLRKELVENEIISPAEHQRTVWRVAFDAAPEPSTRNAFSVTATEPAGFSFVRQLTEEERDRLSLAGLRNLLFPIDEALEEGGAEAVERDVPLSANGMYGSRNAFTIRTRVSSFTFTQVAMVHLDRQLLYLFVIGCETECYSEHEQGIGEVLSSLRIKG